MEAQNKTILLVEDSDFLLLMLKKFFKTLGYKVLIARDGMEAIKIMNEMPPDLIISDYLVPFKNGMELYRYASEIFPRKIPFILVSKYKKLDIANFHGDVKLPEFINKPVNLRELLGYCDNLLNTKN